MAFGKAGSAGAGGIVNVTGTQRINSFLFDTGPTADYTLSGGTLSCTNTSNACTYTTNRSGTITSTIGGTKGLIKEGTQTLTLTGANNTYTGATNINAGIFALSEVGNGFVSSASIATGTELTLNSTNVAVDTMIIGLNNVGTQFTGTSSTINKTGVGWVQGDNNVFANFGGNVNIQGGTLGSAFTRGVFGNANSSMVVNISAGAKFDLRGAGANAARIDQLTGSGSVVDTWNSSGAAGDTLTIGTNNGSSSYGGIIRGAGGGGNNVSDNAGIINLTKVGTGTLTLTGVNTYTGSTIISAGTLTLGDGVVLGNIIPAANLITNNSSLIYNTPSNITHSGIISGTGTLTKSGTGSLTLSGVNTWTGGTTISQGNLISSGGDNAMGTGTITLGDANTGTNDISWRWPGNTRPSNNCIVSNQGTGTVTLGANSAGLNTTLNGTFTFNRAVTINDGSNDRTTITGKISGNVGTITVSGTRVTFGNAGNDFVGNISVSDGSTYQNDSPTALPNTTDVTLNGTGAFRLNGGGTHAIDSLTGGNAGSSVTIIAGGNATLSLGNNNGGATFNGVISDGVAVLSIVKNGTGTQTFGGANTFTGSITINAGTLYITNATGLGGNAGAITMNGGNLTTSVGADTTFPKPITWAANGTWYLTQPDFGRTWNVTGNWTINNGITATVDGNKGTGRTNLNGVISGVGGRITFTGSTPITVNGNNTYTGGTTLNAPANVTCGQVNALGTAGVITVNAGATLNKNGTGCGGARIVNNGGVVNN